MSYSPSPSVVYAEDETGQHGNFLAPAYKRILQQPDWKARLARSTPALAFYPAGRIAHEESSSVLTARMLCS